MAKRYKQTGTRKSIKADRARKAKPPGKRKRPGNKGTYTETRRNRSDVRGKRI